MTRTLVKQRDPARPVQIAITVGALLVIAIRLIWPELKIDAVALGLGALAVLPWLRSLIKSAELPGGWKVEFQEVKSAGEELTQGAERAAWGDRTQPSYVVISDRDPNLAVVGLRIELEKRLVMLATRAGIAERYNLRRIAEELLKRGILEGRELNGLQALINAGNAAAHGALVEPEAAQWAIQRGPDVLAVLDTKLAQIEPPAA